MTMFHPTAEEMAAYHRYIREAGGNTGLKAKAEAVRRILAESKAAALPGAEAKPC